MVYVDGSSLQVDSQTKPGLTVGSCLALSLHSVNELCKLEQWPCSDDCTVNIFSSSSSCVACTTRGA